MKLEFDHETMIELERKRLALQQLLLDGHELLKSLCWDDEMAPNLHAEVFRHLKRFEREI